MKYDFKTLELDSFKEYMKESFVSSFSKKSLDNIKFLKTVEDIYLRQTEIKQAIEFREVKDFIDDDNDFFSLYYSLSDKTKSFDPMDFVIIRNFLNKISGILNVINEKKYNNLHPYASTFNDYDYLKDLISTSINDKGEIKDDATPRLQEIRYSLNEYKNKIKKILAGVFRSNNADKFIQDKVIVLRNGRYTIPCKTNFSQYIQGIIQDKSTSGQTLYIEPSNCVSENNNMQELIIAESEEIAKIIYSLITAVKSSLNTLNVTIKEYSYLIMILEIGLFYNKFSTHSNICFGEIDNKIKMDSIHHPMLYLRKMEESIPIDFEVDKSGNQIIITGPNTGGKTAALKSVGLNHLLTYLGFPVFGSHFKFILFEQIVADIGDNQSIIMDLSTFSAHMLNIKKIVNHVTSNALVLLDELGTGTEPREGASLAVAILKHLDSVGATVILTTHFSEVKNYAIKNDNAYFYSVDFDYETLIPRYKLIKNVMGKSDPIMIAERLGFNKSIIQEAKNELSKYRSSIEVKVEELNRMIAENEHLKKTLEEKEQELLIREEKYNSENQELNKKLSSKELELLEETYSLLQKSKRLASEKMKASSQDIEEDIKKTASKINEIKEKRETIKDIEVGDVIFLDKYGKSAKILEINGNNVSINMEGMRVKLNKKDIVGKKVVEKKEKEVKISNTTSKSSAKREILLVGKRVEEALDLLEKFIDDSLLAGYEKAYIIHGRGTGQLKKAIHEYLRVHPRIKKYRLAENDEGGQAITIVEF